MGSLPSLRLTLQGRRTPSLSKVVPSKRRDRRDIRIVVINRLFGMVNFPLPMAAHEASDSDFNQQTVTSTNAGRPSNWMADAFDNSAPSVSHLKPDKRRACFVATENEARRLQDTQGFCPGYDIDPLEQPRNRCLRVATTFLPRDTSLRRRFHSMQSGLKILLQFEFVQKS